MTTVREQIAKVKALGYEVAIRQNGNTYEEGYQGEWIEADNLRSKPADTFDLREVKEISFLIYEGIAVLIL